MLGVVTPGIEKYSNVQQRSHDLAKRPAYRQAGIRGIYHKHWTPKIRINLAFVLLVPCAPPQVQLDRSDSDHSLRR